MRRVFKISLSRIRPHNTVLMLPKGQDVKVVSITSVSEGATAQLLPSPMTISTPTSVRYDVVSSSSVWIEVEGFHLEDLLLADIMEVSVSLANYAPYGEALFRDQSLSFHEYLAVKYRVEDVKDSFISAVLGIRAIDKYENTVYNEDIHLSLNEDGEMVEYATGVTSVVLPISPEPNSLRVIMGGDQTSEFSLADKVVTVDVPKGVDCYIIYKPFYASSGLYVPLSNNVSINSSGEIRLRDDYCSVINYSIKLRVFNTGITLVNHTPIIKSLALVASDK